MMKCMICGKEMKNTIGGNYQCDCGFGVNDLVNRTFEVCDISMPNITMQGWICPKCGASLSPYTNTCPFCSHSKTITWAATNSTDKFEPNLYKTFASSDINIVGEIVDEVMKERLNNG